jgi:hypothetical protein
MRRIALLAAFLLSAMLVNAQDQTPEILSVSKVVAGAQRTETLYAHAVGKWSDTNEHLAVMSTEITCFDRFGSCDETDATSRKTPASGQCSLIELHTFLGQSGLVWRR